MSSVLDVHTPRRRWSRRHPSREGIKELLKIADPYLPSLLFPSLYSLNNGLTKNGYSENAQFCHSDKAFGRNLDALASRLSSTNGDHSLALPTSDD